MATIFDSHFAKPNNRSASPKPTQHEVEAFGQALKRPEFRAMLCDYVQELSDPANRETYKKEMTQLEGARGNHVTFLIPTPGHVIKTRVLSTPGSNPMGDDDDCENQNVGKVFVNICGDTNIEDASQMVDKRDVQGRIPWAIPFSSSKPRRDVDKAGQKCVVYDVIFHPNVLKRAAGNFQFREMVNLTALDGLEKFFDIKLDRKRLRFPKLKFKGSSHASVVRRPMTEDEKKAYHQKYPDNLSSEKAESKKQYEKNELEESIPKKASEIISEKLEKSSIQDHKNDNEKTNQKTLQPKYVIKYRYEQRDLPRTQEGPTGSDPCRPTSMVVEISLPEMSSAKGIDLDVLEHLLTLESSLPVAYKLVLKLPYPVHDDQGSAKFDKSLHTLAVTLPVKAYKESVSRLVSVDSGIGLEFDEQCDQDQTGSGIRESQEEQDLDSGVCMTKDDGMEDIDLDDHETILERTMPPYVCNIYEGLMVVTMALRNVVASSLKKTVLKDAKGYYLTFHTMGEGFVPINYGFCLSFDFEAVEATGVNPVGGDCHIEDLDVEVWDNNMIVQLSMPKLGCQSYRVGCHPENLGDPLHLPRFEAVKESARYLLGKKNGHNVMKLKPSGDGLDSDDSNADLDEDLENAKERHSSGESNDSAVSFSVPTSPTKLNPGGDENEDPMGGDSVGSNRFLVIPSDFCQSMKDNCNLRGILRRQKTFDRKPRFESSQSESAATSSSLLRMMSSPACSNGSSGTIVEEDENEEMMSGDSMAGSKKSVRFNEVVLRQVYRSNSSILGQKHKNQKKAEQKRRKAGRRASEGDKPDSDSKNSFSPDETEDCYQDQDQDHTNDSGMASSMDESSGSVDLNAGNGNNNKKKAMVGKNSSKPNGESKMKNKRSKVASRFMDETHGHSDLIFNLDFY